MTRQHFNILPRNICAVLLSVVLLLGGVGGRLCAQVLPRISGPTIIDAVQLYSEGNFTEALSALTKLIAANPSDDAAWYYKGLCEAVLNRNEDAKKSFSKAVELDGSNYWYRDRLATIYAMDGEEDLTIAQYEALLEEFPKKRDIHYSLIQLYAQTNQLDKALRSIDEVEAIQGKSDPTVLTKYRILLTQKKNEEALECLKSYVAEYSSPQVLSILGDYEMGMYNDTTAVKYYREALSLDSGYSPARLGIAEAYRMTRRYPEYFASLDSLVEDSSIPAEAKKNYLSAILQNTDPRFLQSQRQNLDSTFVLAARTHPQDTSILQTAGLYFYQTGNQDMAKEYFRKGMEANPQSAYAAGTYAQFLGMCEDWDGMREVAYESAKKFPEQTYFLEMASSAEFSLKNYDKVIENSEILLSKAQGDSARTLSALSTLGDMYHMKGDKKKSYNYYKKALKINPDYAPVLNNYAYYLSVEGKDLKKAYKMSKKTIEKEPDNATYLDTFGWILHLMGKDIEAKPIFKHAMLYGGKNSRTILLHYARVLEKLGEKDLAEVYRGQADKLPKEED